MRPERVNPIADNELATAVDKLPEFPGGNSAFQVFLNKLSKESVKDLAGQSKAFVMVEYVIDSTGKAVYAKAIRGGNEAMNEKIEDAFLAMPQWAPATHSGARVAMKLKQTVMVGAD
jgi:protein TonB